VRDNLGGGEITQLDYLCIIGTPVSATNMSDFKRVSILPYLRNLKFVRVCSLVGR